MKCNLQIAIRTLISSFFVGAVWKMTTRSAISTFMHNLERRVSAVLMFRYVESLSLLNIRLEDIGNGLDQGRFSSVNLVDVYLSRIAEVNGKFRAVVEVNPEARTIAEALDAERIATGRRG